MTVYKGDVATVNSFVISNGKTLTVIDVQRKHFEAEKLVELIRSMALPLSKVFITHGHTDHFTGMHVFRDEFPETPILVANEDLRKDVKAYAIYMDQGGAGEDESPLERPLRPRSESFPEGFDYENTIGLLDGDKLEFEGGGSCDVTTDYPATEAPHMATIYCPSINALFLADLGYNKVHPWMGDDITLDKVKAWQETLKRLRADYSERDPTVYPGHGDPGSLAMLDEQIQYFDDYFRIVGSARSRDDAREQIVALYPDYKEAKWFLHYSLLNHMP